MEKTSGDYKALAAAAYFLFFIPLLVDGARKDDFVRFHIRQGLGLFLTFFILRALTLVILEPLFVIVRQLPFILLPVVNIFLLFLLVTGIMNAIKGEKKPLPIIGEWVEKYLKI